MTDLEPKIEIEKVGENKYTLNPPNGLDILKYLAKFVTYDPYNNKLIIDLDEANLQINGELNIETLKDINIVSHNHNIHLDSFNGCIHLNSLLAKQIKDDPRCVDMLQEYQSGVSDKTVPQKVTNTYNTMIEALKIMNHRLTILEKKINDISE